MTNSIANHISDYLSFCQYNKRLDHKTIKAYKIDLSQFAAVLSKDIINIITPNTLIDYIAYLHKTYIPKTVKRKIACLV